MNRFLIACIPLLLAGCDGGGETPPGTPPAPPPKVCQMVVTWEAPTFYTNGEQMLVEHIAKFTLYVNTAEDMSDATLERIEVVDNNEEVSWVLEAVPEGEYWFYMTVTDTLDKTSIESNQLKGVCPP